LKFQFNVYFMSLLHVFTFKTRLQMGAVTQGDEYFITFNSCRDSIGYKVYKQMRLLSYELHVSSAY